MHDLLADAARLAEIPEAMRAEIEERVADRLRFCLAELFHDEMMKCLIRHSSPMLATIGTYPESQLANT